MRHTTPRALIAIPVWNEERYVERVLQRVLAIHPDVLLIDDGSTDRTPQLIAEYPVNVIRRTRNFGYGRGMRDAFRWAAAERYQWVVTMDCDEQHEPDAIPEFLSQATRGTHDVISGSRYLLDTRGAAPPEDRRAINAEMTHEINARLGLGLTDSFCGFKAYRVAPLAKLALTVHGYAFPMQFWVQAVANGLRIREIPVRLIYNDPTRTFGGPLNDAATRLAHYRHVLRREVRRCAARLPADAADGLYAQHERCTVCEL